MSADPDITLTILMPCLNEAKTLAACIAKAHAYLARQPFQGEIVVADNGSSDGSTDVAASLGARVIFVDERGYGHAVRGGIEEARGEFIVMGDSDNSYDFSALDGFVAQLQAKHDLVVGNRFVGGIKRRAMPPLHRYFGNPFLSAVGRLLYRSPVNDFYCGLRAFRRDAILRLGLTSPGMEFALEMIVKATINGLRITEVPTTLSPDGRERESHLRSWRDGWRSIRFFLMLSPEGLFLYPGLALALISGGASVALIFTDIRVGSVTFAQHTLILTSALTLVGMQSVLFWVLAKSIAIQKKLLFSDSLLKRIRLLFTLEKCLIIGGLLILNGLSISVYALLYWYNLSFGKIDDNALIKVVCAASFLIVLGFQLIFSSFVIYLIDQRTELSQPLQPSN